MDAEKALLPSSPEAADYEPIVKRQKLPPSSSPRYVVVICSCDSDESKKSIFYVFIVDLDSPGHSVDGDFKPHTPTLRLDPAGWLFDDCTFCVVDSKLYMFEAYNKRKSRPKSESESEPEPEPVDLNTKKRVFTLDLSDCLSATDLKVEEHMLQQGPDMHHPKRFPVAIPTPDGKKIVVFSSHILNPQEEGRTGESADFELYDTLAGKWQKLPGICDGWARPVEFSIEASVFLNKSVLLVQSQKGVLSLNLDLPEEGWKPYDGHLPTFGGTSFIIGDDLLLTPLGSFDIKPKEGVSVYSSFPLPAFGVPARDVRCTSHAMTLLDPASDDGECNFCVSRTGLHKTTDHAYLAIDVCSCDVKEYREEKKKDWDSATLETDIRKSFKFLLNHTRFGLFFPIGMFCLRAGTSSS